MGSTEECVMQPEDIFDPKIHLAPSNNASTFTFADLGMTEPGDEDRIAGSHPFPFLSWDGVLAYRRSIFRADVLHQCARPFGKHTMMLRNVASCSKFVRDLWTDPETTKTISKTLGVDVDVIMPYEIGHTNIQVTHPDMPLSCLEVKPTIEEVPLTEEQRNYDPLSAGSVIPWHYDSYPYVCIIMLSHTDSMVGGHTYIQPTNGKSQKVEGPSIGSAVVLQGGRVRHLASRAFGSGERITTITSFRLSTEGTWDQSFLSNVRPYDDLPGLYRAWSIYRLKKMREEIEAMERRLEASETLPTSSPESYEVAALCSQLAAYSTTTARQMTEPSIRDHVGSKFGQTRVAGAVDSWRRIRYCPDLRERVLAASEQTAMMMPEMKPCLLDWHHTKAAIALGVPMTSANGPFRWSVEEEYLFPDELARQGLNELLVYWFDRFGISWM